MKSINLLLKIIIISLFLNGCYVISQKLFSLTQMNQEVIHQRYIRVDFSRPSDQKRFFIYDSDTNTVIFSTYVAHGKNSGRGRFSTTFSNRRGSYQSSLGVYRLSERYYGVHGLSIRLDGLSNSNSNVRSRSIVIHSAIYIGGGKTGHSEGCFAVPIDAMPEILRLTSEGMLMYVTD